ncbi:hypothetical protein [Streptomyces sp. NPDC002851]
MDLQVAATVVSDPAHITGEQQPQEQFLGNAAQRLEVPSVKRVVRAMAVTRNVVAGGGAMADEALPSYPQKAHRYS